MYDPADMTTLGELARANARRRPHTLCNRFEGRDTTFAEFDRNASRVANALGADEARRVAYLGKNSDLAFEAFVGTSRAGGVFAPINWRLAPPEVAAIVANFDPDILMVGPEYHGAMASVRDQLPRGVKLIAMEGGHDEWPSFEGWRDAQSDDHPAAITTPEDVTLVLFTSGTTGLPKGVMLSNANILGQRVATFGLNLGYDWWDDGDVNLVVMPFAHIGGIGWWVIGFVNCCTAVIGREFVPDKVLDHIREDGANRMFLVPAAIQFIIRDPRAKETDFSRVRHITYGAAPMPLPLLREAIEVIGCEFAQTYGMTETTGTICMLPPEDHTGEGTDRMKSAGKAMPGHEIRVIDPDGRELPLGEIGEIAVRGGNCMVGYWNNPDATAATKDREGWVRSGDAGYMDKDGYVYIHDRIKDMIVTGAENVYPAEVESALYAHPAISEAAVIGVPDEKWGEAVKAIVTVKAGQTLDPQDVIAFAHTRLAGFKCPKTVEVIQEMPRNASGKLLKRQLRQPYWEGRDRQVN